ncbi:DUF1471 domain-containing protein, partial [Serratia bockelmannii]|nr:DUF1471 domain-containing protein [Serratia bockelmannii]
LQLLQQLSFSIPPPLWLTVSPDDASSQVSKIADQRGATSYRIIALHEPGDNSTMHVSAELYR